jgi:hypothetical protein
MSGTQGLLTTNNTTAADIIKLALKECGALGVGQTALAEDLNDAFFKLNMMIAQWQRKRWAIYHEVSIGYVADGNPSYTIGPTGKVQVPQRPDKIESAYFRQYIPQSSLPVDYGLTVVQSWEDYSRIALKTLYSFPQFLFYDPGYPNGTIYPWPIPYADQYETFVNIKETLPQFTSLTQLLNIPGEYVAAMFYNLALRLAPAYGLQPNPDTRLMAAEGLNVLKKANVQVPRLLQPAELIRPGIYNPYSDQIR